MPPSHRIATGHHETTQAAHDILKDGGNGVDAAIAALLTACVAEPLLASLGGGGHALVQTDQHPTACLDFFAHTPRQQRTGVVDFYPILGNFGTTTQEFHVGTASTATPGVVAGLDALHARFGSLPKKRLIEPAQRAARMGVALNALQHHTLQILEPIVRATPQAARWARLVDQRAPLPSVGTLIQQPRLADFLDQWAQDGADAFYRGPLANALIDDHRSLGGHLQHADLQGYRAQWRRPLKWRYRDATLWSNPPPAFGGMMLALSTLHLSQRLDPHTGFGSVAHLEALVDTMRQVNDDRCRLEDPSLQGAHAKLNKQFRDLLERHSPARKGTTHISIDDGQGCAVSMTVSNGEGSGHVLEDAGIMMNNMLGEEDINRGGFHCWPVNRRLASMMTPTILHHRTKSQRYLMGSGGSNRIRTALLQVLSHLVDFDMDLTLAIAAPRIHLEGDHLSVELAEAWSPAAQAWLLEHHPTATRWATRSLFFGGVHATGPSDASADTRREGASVMGESVP